MVDSSVYSEYPDFLLVKLQNFHLCLQIPDSESHPVLFLDVLHCLPTIKC